MRHRRKWSPEEDAILKREASLQMEKGGQLKQWSLVAESLPGRTNKDCRKRWAKLGSNINKGPWSADEDERLQAAVEELGCRWTQVAKRVETRHAEQCAKHWQNSLDPSVDHTKWEEDDDKLLQCVQLCGRNWTTIREQYFPTRSPTDLKNRYTIVTRRLKRAAESIPVERVAELKLDPFISMQRHGHDHDDDVDDSMDEDEEEDDEDDEGTPGSSTLTARSTGSNVLLPHPLFPDTFNQSDIFHFGDAMRNVDSAFFSPGTASPNDMTWEMSIPVGDYLPEGHQPMGSMSSESGSSIVPTPPSTDDPSHQSDLMLKPVGGYGDLLHTDPDGGWVGLRNEPEHSLFTGSASQTTLILENVHPEALKSVMSILIETNTKMTVQRHK